MIKMLNCITIEDCKNELEKIDVSSQGVEVMAPKMEHLNIKISDISCGTANILKQEMLRLGCDAAISRGFVEGTREIGDVILMANRAKLNELIKRLNYYQTFELPEIQTQLKELFSRKSKLNTYNDKKIDFSTTQIMAILNVTPDSFSDGGKYSDDISISTQVKNFISNGATIIDVGGESTRPGSKYVDERTELDRVIPAIKTIRKISSEILISIDTNKAKVAEEAILAGADIVNDISALENDKNMINVLKKYPKVGIILMHKQGNPETMQNNPHYDSATDEISNYLQNRIKLCEENCISRTRIIVDPGIGFGKKLEHNLKLIKSLSEFKNLNVPVLLGASRKSFIDMITKSKPNERLAGTLASTVFALENNIEIVRVHDVAEHDQFIRVYNAIRNA
jgi:dihydropteroate synthase